LGQFVGKVGETKTCFTCREQNKRADANRDMDHTRELARANSAKPERKAVKQAWKAENVEKCATYWMDHRKRQIQNDLDAYLMKNSAQAKKWRETNPEKIQQVYLNKKNSINFQYKTYQISASDKKLDFKLSMEEFEQLVLLPCYYCGIIQEKGFNGIDRLDSSEHYIQSNCVSCCEMCNMMKGTSGPNVFVHRAEHILTNQKIIEGQLYPDDFIDISGCSFTAYKIRAENKGLSFDITKEQFETYKINPCYLCGKKGSETHSNGIDRLDNTKGYTLENAKSCCWVCNFMKKNCEYKALIDKLCLICSYQQEHPVLPSTQEENKNPIVKGNKLTHEEKVERSMERKEQSRKALCERYGSDDYIKEKAKELALKRNGM
jgi:hypothetical protein